MFGSVAWLSPRQLSRVDSVGALRINLLLRHCSGSLR